MVDTVLRVHPKLLPPLPILLLYLLPMKMRMIKHLSKRRIIGSLIGSQMKMRMVKQKNLSKRRTIRSIRSSKKNANDQFLVQVLRSEERRVGKECRYRWLANEKKENEGLDLKGK